MCKFIGNMQIMQNMQIAKCWSFLHSAFRMEIRQCTNFSVLRVEVLQLSKRIFEGFELVCYRDTAVSVRHDFVSSFAVAEIFNFKLPNPGSSNTTALTAALRARSSSMVVAVLSTTPTLQTSPGPTSRT